MTSTSKLEELKKQVQDTSNQQIQIKRAKDKAKDIIQYNEEALEQTQKEMSQFVRSVFGQSEIAAAKERELLQDRLDKFSHRQSVMNEQLIELNDNLTDTTALREVYEAKRDLLEEIYQRKQEVLDEQLNSLEELVETRKIDLERLNEDLQAKTSELEKTRLELKKIAFWRDFKETWLHKWLPFATVGFFALIVGGFAGWGVFTLIGNIFSAIGNFFISLLG